MDGVEEVQVAHKDIRTCNIKLHAKCTIFSTEAYIGWEGAKDPLMRRIYTAKVYLV